jgi:deoxycytidine triphosphate deaminase
MDTASPEVNKEPEEGSWEWNEEPGPASALPGQGHPTPSGLLTEREIRDLRLLAVPEGEIDERCYKHASFDLRLGDEYIIPHMKDHNGQLIIGSCQSNGCLTIDKFSSAIVSTYESVRLPNNVAGRFNLRIKHAFEGLVVQMGTQIEPGYIGPLYALLHNVSENSKTIRYRDYDSRPFTIEFVFTASATSPPPNSRKTIRDFVPINYATGSLFRVLEEYDKAQKQIQSISQMAGARKDALFIGVTMVGVLTVVGLLYSFLINKVTYDRDDLPLASAQALQALKYDDRDAGRDDRIVQEVLRQLESRSPAPLGASPASLGQADNRIALHREARISELQVARQTIEKYAKNQMLLHQLDEEIASLKRQSGK